MLLFVVMVSLISAFRTWVLLSLSLWVLCVVAIMFSTSRVLPGVFLWFCEIFFFFFFGIWGNPCGNYNVLVYCNVIRVWQLIDY